MIEPIRPSRAFVALALFVAALSGCTSISPATMARMTEPDLITTRAAPPPGTRADACWAKEETPAVIETITDQVMLQPAEIASDGRVLRPAIFKTETRQHILRERRELWFEIPCELKASPAFVASLQRALSVRAFYNGQIDGTYNQGTRAAVRAYQRPQGLDSGVLSIAAARQMGLVTTVTGAGARRP